MNFIRIRKPGYFREMQEEMNRMLENMFSDIGMSESEKGEMIWKPAIEFDEMNGNYQIKAELPGVQKENIDVEVNEDSVVIKAHSEKKEEEKQGNMYESEFRYGNYMRKIALPSQVKSNEAKAEFKDGILTLTLPKTPAEQAKSKRLKIGD